MYLLNGYINISEWSAGKVFVVILRRSVSEVARETMTQYGKECNIWHVMCHNYGTRDINTKTYVFPGRDGLRLTTRDTYKCIYWSIDEHMGNI